MTSPQEPFPAKPDDSTSSADLPPIEDAYASDEDAEQPPEEDDSQLLDAAARALEAGSDEDIAAEESPPQTAASATAERDESSDTGDLDTNEVARDDEVAAPKEANWAAESSAHRLIVELKRIEGEVRDLLADRDPKRKRKLAGTRRWLELEEDLIAWRYSDRFDVETLRRLNELVARRHHLFRRLRFLAATRPTWNT